jgi:hypothetical protein
MIMDPYPIHLPYTNMGAMNMVNCPTTRALPWGEFLLLAPQGMVYKVRRVDAHNLVICWVDRGIPSGKHTKNYGKSQSLKGKSTINGMGYFQSLC